MINNNTKINFLSEHPNITAEKEKKYREQFNDDNILKSKIVNVKNAPKLKDLIEVSGLEEIRKITQSGNLVSKYEDDKQIIYFTEKYSFIKKKKV
jgi:hypothetical protein